MSIAATAPRQCSFPPRPVSLLHPRPEPPDIPSSTLPEIRPRWGSSAPPSFPLSLFFSLLLRNSPMRVDDGASPSCRGLRPTADVQALAPPSPCHRWLQPTAGTLFHVEEDVDPNIWGPLAVSRADFSPPPSMPLSGGPRPSSRVRGSAPAPAIRRLPAGLAFP